MIIELEQALVLKLAQSDSRQSRLRNVEMLPNQCISWRDRSCSALSQSPGRNPKLGGRADQPMRGGH